jgi:hypothetical protein
VIRWRQGIAARIPEACEDAARDTGFRSAELVATVTGEGLYAAGGYTVIRRFERTTVSSVPARDCGVEIVKVALAK